jgi:hypothetical protein
MKRPIWLLFASTLLAPAQNYGGWVDAVNCSTIAGWAWDGNAPYSPILVDIYDGSLPVATVLADQFRQDLVNAGIGDGRHGFNFPVPASLKDGQTHRIGAFFAGTGTPLGYGFYHYSLNCSSGSGYQYYYTDVLASINPANWIQNGGLTAGSGGLTSSDPSGGSLISRIPAPDGSSDYEIRSTLSITQSGGVFVHYASASPDARTGPAASGTFYSVEVAPALNGGNCSATLTVNQRVAGVITTLGSSIVGCRNGMELRTKFGNGLMIAIDGTWLAIPMTPPAPIFGSPGVGVIGAPSGNALTRVQLGPADRVAPGQIDVRSIRTSVSSQKVDMKWQGVVDDPNGAGILFYIVYRNGSYLLLSHGVPEFTDQTVAAGASYTYSIAAIDWHLNQAPAVSFTVAIPSQGSVDPKQLGVRPTGSYWGGLGENIDLRSGNLNFTLPLLEAQARGGWKLPIHLTYNSQNWRWDEAATWNLGADVGYGYGWKLLAGSLTPYWRDYYAFDHYVFTDSTGAEYRLDVNNGGIWTSRNSVYVSYDSNTNRLYFNDGSFWVMGCTSAGTEQDAGTMYPTLVQDANGNQIFLRYQPRGRWLAGFERAHPADRGFARCGRWPRRIPDLRHQLR